MNISFTCENSTGLLKKRSLDITDFISDWNGKRILTGDPGDKVLCAVLGEADILPLIGSGKNMKNLACYIESAASWKNEK